MGNVSRTALFIAVALLVWGGLHAYFFSRLLSIPAVNAHLRGGLRVGLVLILSVSYPLARVLARRFGARIACPVEVAGGVWMGVLFLGVVSFFVADVLTGFGHLAPGLVVPARTVAACTAGLLSAVALVQGLRIPRVVPHEVALRGLPPELDGTRLVQLSDLHLGTLLGASWLSRRLDLVERLRPDLLAVTGDLVDSEVGNVAPLLPELRRLRAPLGVWGVTGNHEFYAGLEKSVALYAAAGIRVLRNTWAEVVPGLVIAGIDDLSARRQFGIDGRPWEKALSGRPAGATLYLSHSPLRVLEAAALGAGLMLSGHTHAGQIWPFTLVSSIPYPFQSGRYEVDGLTLLVSRGTGTWGPPMRLFRRSEILLITLRSSPAAAARAG